jgi:hypothetical protein
VVLERLEHTRLSNSDVNEQIDSEIYVFQKLHN